MCRGKVRSEVHTSYFGIRASEYIREAKEGVLQTFIRRGSYQMIAQPKECSAMKGFLFFRKVVEWEKVNFLYLFFSLKNWLKRIRLIWIACPYWQLTVGVISMTHSRAYKADSTAPLVHDLMRLDCSKRWYSAHCRHNTLLNDHSAILPANISLNYWTVLKPHVIDLLILPSPKSGFTMTFQNPLTSRFICLFFSYYFSNTALNWAFWFLFFFSLLLLFFSLFFSVPANYSMPNFKTNNPVAPKSLLLP